MAKGQLRSFPKKNFTWHNYHYQQNQNINWGSFRSFDIYKGIVIETAMQIFIFMVITTIVVQI